MRRAQKLLLALNKGGGAAPISAIALNQIASGRVFQRAKGTTSGPIRITGTTTGRATAVQAQVHLTADDSIVTAWATIDASPGASTFSGTISAPQGGPYYVKVRDSVDTAVTATGSTNCYVGIVLICYGQSNMNGMFGKASSAPAASAGTAYFDGSVWTSVPDSNGVREMLNGVKSLTGIPVGALNGAVNGTSSGGLIEGTANFTALATQIAASGGDGEFIVVRHGEGDADAPGTKLNFKTNWTAIHASIAAAVGRTVAQIPMIFASLSTFGDLQSVITDTEWWTIQQGIKELCDESANIDYSHSMMDAVRDDVYHSSAASHGKSGKRFAQSIAVRTGDQSTQPAWFMTGATVVDATHTDITVVHSMGTDFTPTSGITGFIVSNDNGGTYVTPSAAVRQDATTIRLTHSDLGTVNNRLIQYQYGTAPDVSAPVLDNGTLTSPLNLTAGQTIAAAGSGALPTITYRASGNATTTVSNTIHTSAGLSTGAATAAADLMVVVAVNINTAGSALNSVTLTPNGGSPISGTLVAGSSSVGAALYRFLLPAGTTGADSCVIVATFSANTGNIARFSLWTVPAADLSSQTPVDSQQSSVSSTTAASVGLTTTSGGFIIAAACSFLSANSCTWSGSEAGLPGGERDDTSHSAGRKSVTDVSAVAAAAGGSSTVTATFASSANIRLVAASWR